VKMQQMNCVVGVWMVQLGSRRSEVCHNLVAKAVCLAEKYRY
jgi:hypothetical protein